MQESKRYLGLELAGAKNQKTCLAALEFFPQEGKIFLLDIFDRISPKEDQTGDEALLEVFQEVNTRVAKMGVNVPLDLPPCIPCTRKVCPLPHACTVPSVKWMRETSKKALKDHPKASKHREFTPYTQRPFELWVRHRVFPKLPENHLFEIDEALGGNRAPLTARMHFLKRHFQKVPLVEVWPKLSVASLAKRYTLHKRTISTYRHLEYGPHSREEILSQIAKDFEVFIYERDMKKLSLSLAAFDAFICALTALLSDQKQCVKIPTGFPTHSGWIEYPRLE